MTPNPATTAPLARRLPSAVRVRFGPRVLLALLLVLVASGCSSGDPVATSPSAPPVTATPTPVAPDCASIYAGVNAGRLPEGSVLDSATLCQVGASGPVVVTVDRATSSADLDRLATLLARPDDPVDPAVVCTMEIRIVADFTVSPQGAPALAAHVPTDVCGKPDLAVVTLLDRMLAGDTKG